MRNGLFIAVAISITSCAVNPHTGKAVITMGTEIEWNLETNF